MSTSRSYFFCSSLIQLMAFSFSFRMFTFSVASLGFALPPKRKDRCSGSMAPYGCILSIPVVTDLLFFAASAAVVIETSY